MKKNFVQSLKESQKSKIKAWNKSDSLTFYTKLKKCHLYKKKEKTSNPGKNTFFMQKKQQKTNPYP